MPKKFPKSDGHVEARIFDNAQSLADLRGLTISLPLPKPPRRSRPVTITQAIQETQNRLGARKLKPVVPADIPSDFYHLVDGGVPAVLKFPVDKDQIGPYWEEDGQLVAAHLDNWEEEDVLVAPLGGNRYRLCEAEHGLFSKLLLMWGDEFFASDEQQGVLCLRSVVMPRPFVHFRFITSAPFGNDNALAKDVHAMGGGWETLAGGVLTLTVPAARAEEFQRLMQGDTPEVPGVLRLQS